MVRDGICLTSFCRASHLTSAMDDSNNPQLHPPAAHDAQARPDEGPSQVANTQSPHGPIQ